MRHRLMPKTIAAGAALLLACAGAEATPPTGGWDDPVVAKAAGISTANDLYHYCSMPNTTPPKVSCVTYIGAFTDTYSFIVDHHLMPAVICPQTNWTTGTELGLFLKNAAKHPDALTVSAAAGLMAAFVAASPCQPPK